MVQILPGQMKLDLSVHSLHNKKLMEEKTVDDKLMIHLKGPEIGESENVLKLAVKKPFKYFPFRNNNHLCFKISKCRNWKHFSWRPWCYICYLQTVWLHILLANSLATSYLHSVVMPICPYPMLTYNNNCRNWKYFKCRAWCCIQYLQQVVCIQYLNSVWMHIGLHQLMM